MNVNTTNLKTPAAIVKILESRKTESLERQKERRDTLIAVSRAADRLTKNKDFQELREYLELLAKDNIKDGVHYSAEDAQAASRQAQGIYLTLDTVDRLPVIADKICEAYEKNITRFVEDKKAEAQE